MPVIYDELRKLATQRLTHEKPGQSITNQGLVTGDGELGGTFENSVAGELRAEPGRSLKLTGSGNTSSGQINLLGGLIEFTRDLANNASGFISGNGTLIVRNGLVNRGTISFSGSANVIGDTTNAAGGKVISGGGDATIFYDDVTNNGEIRTSTDGFTIFYGSVSGGGTFTGTGTVNFEGDLNPGISAAAVQFAGDVIFGSEATLQVELGGSVLGTQYDHIRVAGDLALDGSLNVTLINDFQPTIGQSFNILDWLGTRTGTFSSLSLPALAGLTWDTSQLYTTGVLSVAAGLAGDFNGDGSVDAADYVVWRKFDGTPSGYDEWRSNFGATLDSGSTVAWPSHAAVPEPASTLLLLFGAAAGIWRRRVKAIWLPLTHSA